LFKTVLEFYLRLFEKAEREFEEKAQSAIERFLKSRKRFARRTRGDIT